MLMCEDDRNGQANVADEDEEMWAGIKKFEICEENYWEKSVGNWMGKGLEMCEEKRLEKKKKL